METNLVGLSGPIMISIDVTYRCNFRCKHCFNGSGAPLLGDELSDAELLTIAKSVGVLQPNVVCFCGGEPLLRWEILCDACETIKSKSPYTQVNLVTNSTMVDILEKCDGKTAVQDLFSTLYDEYKMVVSRNEFEADVFSSLHSLWRLGLVEWINHHPFMDMYISSEENYDFSLLTEDEAVDELQKYNGHIFEPYLQPTVFQSERAIRQNAFTFNESLFKMTNDKKCIAMLSLITPVFFNTTLLRMRYLSFDDSLDMGELKKFILWCVNKIGEILNKSYTGVVLFNDTTSSHSRQKLLETGFTICGSLNNERSSMDTPVDIYFLNTIALGHML